MEAMLGLNLESSRLFFPSARSTEMGSPHLARACISNISPRYTLLYHLSTRDWNKTIFFCKGLSIDCHGLESMKLENNIIFCLSKLDNAEQTVLWSQVF